MKFEMEAKVNGAFVPRSALALSGLSENQELELHTPKGAVVLIRKRMTAMELAETIDALGDLATQLIGHLVQACGFCEDCGDNGCPYKDGCYVELPDYLRQEAGIPQGAKLCATADQTAGTVTISKAEYANDLRDISPSLLAALQESGVCMGELEERLMMKEVVYGS